MVMDYDKNVPFMQRSVWKYICKNALSSPSTLSRSLLNSRCLMRTNEFAEEQESSKQNVVEVLAYQPWNGKQ